MGSFLSRKKNRDIPIYVLKNKLEDHSSSLIILKTHLFTRYDVTSKIGGNSSAMKNNPEKFLEDYRTGAPCDATFKSAKQYSNLPYSELFWSVFTLIWTEYGEILRIFPYSVRMRENVDQNNSKYGHFSRSHTVEKNEVGLFIQK